MEISLVGVLCGGVKVKDYVEGEGCTVVHKLYAGVGDSLMDLHANVEALDRCLEGVKGGFYHVFLVFRQHGLEVLKVRERHVQLMGLT